MDRILGRGSNPLCQTNWGSGLLKVFSQILSLLAVASWNLLKGTANAIYQSILFSTPTVSLLTPTRVAGVNCSSVSVYVCVSVVQAVWFYRADRQTDRQTDNHQTFHRDSPSWVFATHLILSQKVKDQGPKVTKCKKKHMLFSGDRVAGISLHLYRLPFVYYYKVERVVYWLSVRTRVCLSPIILALNYTVPRFRCCNNIFLKQIII